jgi:hypothetical protein
MKATASKEGITMIARVWPLAKHYEIKEAFLLDGLLKVANS